MHGHGSHLFCSLPSCTRTVWVLHQGHRFPPHTMVVSPCWVDVIPARYILYSQGANSLFLRQVLKKRWGFTEGVSSSLNEKCPLLPDPPCLFCFSFSAGDHLQSRGKIMLIIITILLFWLLFQRASVLFSGVLLSLLRHLCY